MTDRKTLALAVGLVLAALVPLGCSKSAPTKTAAATSTSSATSQQQVTLNVWVPCGLSAYTSKFDKLLASPGVKPEYQIVDLWDVEKRLRSAKVKPDLIIMPGDQELRGLFRKHLLAKAPVAWAFNQLAVLTPHANPSKIGQLSDLTKATTLVLSPPTSSTGYYAKAALKNAGLSDKLQKHIVFSKTPADIYKLLADGKAQAAIAYAGCAFPTAPLAADTEGAKLPAGAPKAPKQRKVLDLGPLPEKFSPAFPAMVGIPTGAANPGAAATAIKNLLSDQSQADIATWMPAPAQQSKLTANRIDLRVYCGAGIRPPVERVAKSFEQTHPNVHMDISYAGSGCLLAQLTFTKRGDLYLPGETFYLKQARDHGFLTETQHIAYFVPVILVAKGNPKHVKGLEDLLRPDVKAAIGEPDACAVGRVTKLVYQHAGLWSKLQARQPREALNVPELAYWVGIGASDAAVVWQAQAHQSAKRCDSISIPTKFYGPVDISIGLLKFTKHADMAREFMRAIASPESQAIFKDEGYALHPPKPSS